MFSLPGDQGNQWLSAKVELTSGKYQILIEGSVGGERGDIAVDAIAVFSRSCRGVTDEFDAYVLDTSRRLISDYLARTGMAPLPQVGSLPGQMNHTFKDWVCYGMDKDKDHYKKMEMGMDMDMDMDNYKDDCGMKEDPMMMPMNMEDQMMMQHKMILHQHMMMKALHTEMKCMENMCMAWHKCDHCYDKDLTGVLLRRSAVESRHILQTSHQ